MALDDEWEELFEKLEKKHERGEISEDELIRLGNASYQEMLKQCPHKDTTTKTQSSGAWIESCDRCGARVGSGGSGQLAASKGGSGCVVVGIALAGGVGAVLYGVVEVVRGIV